MVTYTNGEVATHTDPRGLAVTYSWDGLLRLTNAVYPDGAIKYPYNRLDLSQTIDKLNQTNRFVHDGLRHKIQTVGCRKPDQSVQLLRLRRAQVHHRRSAKCHDLKLRLSRATHECWFPQAAAA